MCISERDRKDVQEVVTKPVDNLALALAKWT